MGTYSDVGICIREIEANGAFSYKFREPLGHF